MPSQTGLLLLEADNGVACREESRFLLSNATGLSTDPQAVSTQYTRIACTYKLPGDSL